MNRPTRPRWALLVLTVAALALAGCGRKAGLDLPPNAAGPQSSGPQSSGPQSSAAPAVDPDVEAAASKGTVFDPSYGTERGPVAARGRKRPFILDPILN